MKTTSFQRFCRRGYTLIEVLAAGAIVSIGMAAAVSLASSLMLQEELAWRTAITRNYQENMMRLWQLGLSPTFSKDVTNIMAVMPRQSFSPKLNEALTLDPSFEVLDEELKIGGFGTLQQARVQAIVNVSADSKKEISGSSYTLNGYRPALPLNLRTSAANP